MLPTQLSKLFIQVLFLTCFYSFSQTDFQNYRPLLASGTMPDDFRLSYLEKFEKVLAENPELRSNTQQKNLIRDQYRMLEEILYSGNIIYGDPISDYCRDIAEKLLLHADKELLDTLRFYCIKDNNSNAFSTFDGMIFVTTGLLSQMTNEEQLAFVIAHEIGHFKKRHLLQLTDKPTVVKRSKIDFEALANYSRNNELEADNFAVELLHKAGYSKDEIESTFDVLMYSYLPFEEEHLDYNWLTFDGKITFPPSYFINDVTPITAIEDYDDNLSSHPNIKKRKENALTEIAKKFNWGTSLFLLGENRFEELRDISRFESVLLDLSDGRYVAGLYSLYLLENKFRESDFIRRMKVILLHSMNTYDRGTSVAKQKKEGEISRLYAFLSNLSKEELKAVELRAVYDYYQHCSMDKASVSLLSTSLEKPKLLENYKAKSIAEAQLDLLKEREKSTATDTMTAVKNNAASNKYTSIRSKKTDHTINLNTFLIDSSYYYQYNYADILGDSAFVNLVKTYSSKSEQITDSNQQVSGMIVVSLNYQSIDNKPPPQVKQLKYQQHLNEAVQITVSESGTSIIELTPQRIRNEASTALFNDRLIANTFFNLHSAELTKGIDNAYFYQLDSLTAKYGTNVFCAINLSHEYWPNINGAAVFYTALCWPLFPLTVAGYIPIQLIRGHRSTIELYIAHHNDTKPTVKKTTLFRNMPKKFYVAAYLDQLLKQTLPQQ